ncbi:hypothetical protein Dip510_001791 [Elusimicrobium posterum]|uniref:hypothetical protein n=1 Tax=Elusimicrobium posterum TaxID=3116653 RepID=UPI003C766008
MKTKTWKESPLVFGVLYFIAFICFVSLIAALLKPLPFVEKIIGAFLCAFFTYFLIITANFFKKISTNITLSSNFVKINKNKFPWEDIKDIVVMHLIVNSENANLLEKNKQNSLKAIKVTLKNPTDINKLEAEKNIETFSKSLRFLFRGNIAFHVIPQNAIPPAEGEVSFYHLLSGFRSKKDANAIANAVEEFKKEYLQ